MSKTVADLEAQLAAAKAQQAADVAAEKSKADARAAVQRQKDALAQEIAQTDAGIEHLKAKIVDREAHKADLAKQVAALG